MNGEDKAKKKSREFINLQPAEQTEEEEYRRDMECEVEPMVAGYISSMIADLVIEDHGIHEERAVIRIFDCIEQTSLEGCDQVAEVLIVIVEVADENGVIQIGEAILESREIYYDNGKAQPQQGIGQFETQPIGSPDICIFSNRYFPGYRLAEWLV